MAQHPTATMTLEAPAVPSVQPPTPRGIPARRNKARILDRFSIPRATFARVVREIAETMKKDVLFEPEALIALHTDAEEFVAERFRRAGLLAERFCTRTVTERHFRDLDASIPQRTGVVSESSVPTPPETPRMEEAAAEAACPVV